jgi:mono/diheme cytochrome c family protein
MSRVAASASTVTLAGSVQALIFAVLLATVLPVRVGAADGAAAIAAGERTYALRCRGCHAPPFTGFFMLSRRLGAAQADLAERGEVNGDYVKVVVRNGLNSMPHIPRGDISDAQLAEIIAYLNRPRAATAAAGDPR